jgi:enoyl-CoA hydratase
MTSGNDILFQSEGDIGWITLNRPEHRNALTFEMYRRLADICMDPPQHVKVLVLTGAGDRAFAAGTDISQFREFTTPKHATDYEATMDEVLGKLESCRIPTIAAISGACTGGGAAIAVACDLRIATADLRFGFPIARTLGNCLSAANIARLSALIGAGRVREMVFLSRLMQADEALRVGLVSEVLDSHDLLMKRVGEIAEQVIRQAPLTLRATKEIQRRLAQGDARDEDWIIRCYMSADFREGLDAFLTKREPRWKGR